MTTTSDRLSELQRVKEAKREALLKLDHSASDNQLYIAAQQFRAAAEHYEKLVSQTFLAELRGERS